MRGKARNNGNSSLNGHPDDSDQFNPYALAHLPGTLKNSSLGKLHIAHHFSLLLHQDAPLRITLREGWYLMGMLVTITFFFGCFHAAIETVHLAAGPLVIIALELNGGVTDMILLLEHGAE